MVQSTHANIVFCMIFTYVGIAFFFRQLCKVKVLFFGRIGLYILLFSFSTFYHDSVIKEPIIGLICL